MSDPIFPHDLLLSSYDFDLPHELIAQSPIEVRHNSRLLVYKARSKEVIHSQVFNIDNFLLPRTHLVFNQSKVFPCRVLAKKETGGAVEIFFLAPKMDQDFSVNVLLKSSRKKDLGTLLVLPDLEFPFQIHKINSDGTFTLKYIGEDAHVFSLKHYLENFGHTPLPPYINREAGDEDKINYQNCFARDLDLGSVAAPTAGLHFTAELLEKLKHHAIDLHWLTLHVGLGTFLPVKENDITKHKMHSEHFFMEDQEWNVIKNNLSQTIAVGTTSFRSLHSKWMGIDKNATDVYVYPGQKVVPLKGLLTNFHLPKSTLLMLVSALIGREKTLELYHLAIQEKYRFFSYGDAMLILMNE